MAGAALAARLGALLDEAEGGAAPLEPRARELEALYERKLALLAERLGALEHERDDARFRLDEERTRAGRAAEEAAAAAGAAAEAARAEHRAERAQLEAYSAYLVRHYETLTGQAEEEHAFQQVQLQARIAELRASQADKAAEEVRTKLIIQLRREVEVAQDEREQAKREFLIQMVDKDELMRATVEARTKSAVAEAAALADKLKDKTMECVQLSKDAKRAASERAIMAYHLAEQKEELGPLERSIALLHEQGEAYEAERLRNAAAIGEFKRKLADAAARAAVLSGGAASARRLAAARDKVVQAFSHEVHAILNTAEPGATEDPGFLRAAMLGLYDRFVRGSAMEEELRNPDLGVLDANLPARAASERLPVLEFARQREALQRAARSQGRAAAHAKTRLLAERRHAAAENAELLAENRELCERLAAALRGSPDAKSPEGQRRRGEADAANFKSPEGNGNGRPASAGNAPEATAAALAAQRTHTHSMSSPRQLTTNSGGGGGGGGINSCSSNGNSSSIGNINRASKINSSSTTSRNSSSPRPLSRQLGEALSVGALPRAKQLRPRSGQPTLDAVKPGSEARAGEESNNAADQRSLDKAPSFARTESPDRVKLSRDWSMRNALRPRR
jgi:hypothetical protein